VEEQIKPAADNSHRAIETSQGGTEVAPGVAAPAAPERPTAPAVQSSPTSTPHGPDEALVAQVLRLLTRLVGPIAPILVRKARDQAADFDAFSHLIADRLDAKERRQFLDAVAALPVSRAKP
jgi:hypothetical protein